MIILVGVDLDTMRQLDGMMKMHHHDGFVESKKRKSSDMLYYKPVAGSLGYTQIPMNVGSMTNSGLEIDLNYNILNTKNITWDFNVNATFIKNKINELHPDRGGSSLRSP